MVPARCKQCPAEIWLPNSEQAVQWLIAHVRAQHSLHPHPLEFAEGRLMADIQRDYAGHDEYGRLGTGPTRR